MCFFFFGSFFFYYIITTLSLLLTIIQYISTDIPKNILSTTCYGLNIYTDGKDPVLKPHNEYPDWLHKLVDPVTLTPQDKAWWKQQKKAQMKSNNENSSKK